MCGNPSLSSGHMEVTDVCIPNADISPAQGVSSLWLTSPGGVDICSHWRQNVREKYYDSHML